MPFPEVTLHEHRNNDRAVPMTIAAGCAHWMSVLCTLLQLMIVLYTLLRIVAYGLGLHFTTARAGGNHIQRARLGRNLDQLLRKHRGENLSLYSRYLLISRGTPQPSHLLISLARECGSERAKQGSVRARQTACGAKECESEAESECDRK